ncbi:hypothetical protein NTD86_02295, partial [Pseudomonas sp. 7P_10.2_Bac1]|uniref:hypothetical protein n=1 Tax=Pseudomonas sp. 7P_10.2_Bac1 TaxID=2971614 RepID=UPI0021C66187
IPKSLSANADRDFVFVLEKPPQALDNPFHRPQALAACSLQLAACSLQLAACSLQLAACSLQLAAQFLNIKKPP